MFITALSNIFTIFFLKQRKKCFQAVFFVLLILVIVSIPLFSSEKPSVFWVPLKDVSDLGAVEWGLASFTRRALLEAQEQGAEVVVFEIDTFGGRVDAMLFMKDLILNAPIKTVAFVNSKAWSAGVFLALSCEVIMMAPDASMGAAEPRTGQETAETPPDPKTISAIRAQIEALAETRKRDPHLFAAMVDRNIEIEGLKEKGELLTLTATAALERGAADYIARNQQEVLEKLGLKEPVINTLSPSWSETLARILTHPTIVPLLLLVAFGGILIEIMTPGFGFPGAAGIVALLLFFGGRYFAGLAGWEPLILFLAGILLLSLELLVIPGFGITGITGIGALAVSLYLVLRTTSVLFWEVAFSQLLLYMAIMGGIFLVLLFFLPNNPIWKKMGLYKNDQQQEILEEKALNDQSLVGKKGLTKTILRPSGIVEIEWKRYDVVTRGEFIEPGKIVVVDKVEGNRIIVQIERGV
ncbi:MAG: hypothetical protein NTX88_01585 [Candidatus Atribacteria bacterium]|nr:hypothetical protein [Candidatus Atribacteria bacterium]